MKSDRGLSCANALAGLAVLVVACTVSTTTATTVHVIQTCHLDVGFADTAAGELNNYRRYLVDAVLKAQALRNMKLKHNQGLIWTTHPYIVSLLVDCPPDMGFTCPNGTELDIIEQGLRAGDLVMQAFPHNSETATLSPILFQSALDLGKSLAKRYNVSAPTVMTQRDVPGATRSIIPHLVKNGIKAYSGGVNRASLPPDFPRVFRWQESATNQTIFGMLHPFGYGGILTKDCVVIDGFDHILCPDYAGDNQGPKSITEILGDWDTIMNEFPGATVIPSTFDTYVAELESFKGKLPVLMDEEMADTWIYGIGSDPYKVAHYRALERSWETCLASKQCDPNDPQIQNFTRLLLKNPEHTWGGDVKVILRDINNYLNSQFHPLQYTAPNFKAITETWNEQRRWGIDFPIQAVESHAQLSSIIQKEFSQLVPTKPDLNGLTQATTPGQTMQCSGWKVAFDPKDGSMIALQDPATTSPWATSTHRLAQFQYEVHSTKDYFTFFDEYAQRSNGKIPDYFPMDFGKPGLYNDSVIENHITAYASVSNLYYDTTGAVCRFVLEMKMANETLVSDYGAPAAIYSDVTLNTTNKQLNVRFTTLNKTATRLPESAWLKFNPNVSPQQTVPSGWMMDKLGYLVDPLNVVINGSRHLHSVNGDVSFTPQGGSQPVLTLNFQDMPLISFGDTNPFPTPSGAWQPTLGNGINGNLWNNIWGTNYIMWTPFNKDETGFVTRYTLSFA
eukprot:m.64385 g.64385  ORF g.64385 m.64385 type:complete len:732 (+) comp12011_c0_seq2:41-2236(+)